MGCARRGGTYRKSKVKRHSERRCRFPPFSCFGGAPWGVRAEAVRDRDACVGLTVDCALLGG